jgi:hypothetical protein
LSARDSTDILENRKISYSCQDLNPYHHGFWLENLLKEMDCMEVLHTDRRKILKWILREIRWYGVDCMYLVQGRDQRQAPVNTIMDLHITPLPPTNTN